MGSFYRLSFLCILFVTLAAASTANAQTPTKTQANIGRFALRSTIPHDNKNLTDAERYAKWLVSRRPTRRLPGMRRQAPSDVPVTNQAATVMNVQDTQTQQDVGNLVYSPDSSSWTISSTDSPTTLTYTPTSGVVARDAQRLTTTADSTYPVFGIGQCNPGGPTTIGAGSSNVLCLVNTASSGTSAGAIPALLSNNLDPSGTSYVETDLWNLDYTTGVASAQWINPDGSTSPTYVVVAVTNPNIIFVTGDIAATSAAYGLEFRQVSLNFLTGS